MTTRSLANDHIDDHVEDHGSPVEDHGSPVLTREAQIFSARLDHL